MVEYDTALPSGLGFGLAMNQKAMENFACMTEEEKQQVISAARNVQSKKEMQNLVRDIADLNRTF